ncbi:MAG: CBS domain-containing protein [Labilithrix sp.]|nr:CBS domain-containing protein [Labilithrix sp.]MCW5812538.1 CBS domain-containing protein [Labilithrix sp.]
MSAAAARSRRITIGEVMTPAPYTIGSDQKLSVAHRKMKDNALRHLPVLRAGKLVGVLSQRDLYFVESMAGVDVDIDVIADAMTSDVYTTAPDAALCDVAAVMAEKKYGCAVVVDRDRVVGVFTVTDAVRQLADGLA